MQHSILPPREPQPPQPIRPPMVYIERQIKWEYKQILRDLDHEQPLDEAELNALGQDGWELTSTIQHPPLTYFYFKRQIEE